MSNIKIIPNLFNQFIEAYPTISGYTKLDTTPAILKRINSGDCGTASLAVGKILEEQLGMDVTYVTIENRLHGHAVIMVGGVFYDTLDPRGVDAIYDLTFFKSRQILNPSITFSSYNKHMKKWIHESDELGFNILRKFNSLIIPNLGEI